MIKFILKYGFLLIFFWGGAEVLVAQETMIVGQVFDKFNHTPLANVNVYFKNSNTAVQTNEEGYFKITNYGNQNVLVFSLLGYKKEETKVKPGTQGGMEVELEEKQNYLMDVFITPGKNPAEDLIRASRKKRHENNFRSQLESTEQSAVFINQNNSHFGARIFRNFEKGSLTPADSSQLIPIYMEQAEFLQNNSNKKILAKNSYNSTQTVTNTVSQLLNGMDSEINFYDNSVPLFNKSIISPLGNLGPSYYKYYLKDSINTSEGKQYSIDFWSKNTKNLALIGNLKIDSATLALVHIEGFLPQRANINFINNYAVNQSFTKVKNYWIPQKEQVRYNIEIELIKDSANTKPELLISRDITFKVNIDSLIPNTNNFANTSYSEEQLNEKISALNTTSLFKFAKFVADAALTGYMKLGKIDIGNVISIARVTTQEGFKLNLPLRTNENLWKNFMLGGSAGYGFGNKKWNYGGEMAWKLPFEKKFILDASYQYDYHWITYNKNDNLWHEYPLSSWDENFSTTILSFRKGKNNSLRENYSFSIKNDWNYNIESKWLLGGEKFYANDNMPLKSREITYSTLNTRYISFTTRFSFNQKVINEHFQRLYITNDKPVIYTVAEAGKYMLPQKSGYYGHLRLDIFQQKQFTLGDWKYYINAGKILGEVPYPLLSFFSPRIDGAYSFFQFSMMDFYEYPMDSYIALHTEIKTNGIIFNSIPLIKSLNLREIASFKVGYGTLNKNHENIMDFPSVSSKLTKPYAEASIGITNILKVFTFQSIWRLSDLNKPNVKKWRIVFYLNLGL